MHMKKLLFALPVILLVAAGCNSSQPTTEQTQPTQQPQTQQQAAVNPSPAPTQPTQPATTPTPATTPAPTITSNTKTFTNAQYSFEFQYPNKNLSVADGFVSSFDPKGLVYVVNIFTIPHGSDRDGLVGVFNQSLSQTLGSLGFTGQTLPTVNYNGITWTKLPRQDTPSDYLVEKNGKTFWLGYDGMVKQADFQTIITTFTFTK